MRVIMKFGGAALSEANGINNALSIVKRYVHRHDQVIVVVSALPNVTDRLIEASAAAAKGDLDPVNRFIAETTRAHADVIQGCVRDPLRSAEAVRELKQTIDELSGVLRSIWLLKEISPRSQDLILSFGERISAAIFSAAANDSGLPAEWFTGGAAGIITNEDFGEATPLPELTTHKVRDRLLPPLSAGKIPVVAGYGAETPSGVTTTLGRGGSDYTATLLGAALDADETIIWKNVDGLMTADPRIVTDARVLSTLSYAEACEMTYFGAKAIHPKALEPAIGRGMPVRIRNAFNLRSEGTTIKAGSSSVGKEVVKAVTLIGKVGLVTVIGVGMVGLIGSAARIFKALADANVNILMISQSSSEQSISFVVQKEKLQKTVTALERGVLGGVAKDINAESDVCVIAAVGAGMKGTPGVAARVLRAVADEGVNVRMIAQGSSELNISFVVSENDGPKAVRAIHREFGLSKA